MKPDMGEIDPGEENSVRTEICSVHKLIVKQGWRDHGLSNISKSLLLVVRHHSRPSDMQLPKLACQSHKSIRGQCHFV